LQGEGNGRRVLEEEGSRPLPLVNQQTAASDFPESQRVIGVVTHSPILRGSELGAAAFLGDADLRGSRDNRCSIKAVD